MRGVGCGNDPFTVGARFCALRRMSNFCSHGRPGAKSVTVYGGSDQFRNQPAASTGQAGNGLRADFRELLLLEYEPPFPPGASSPLETLSLSNFLIGRLGSAFAEDRKYNSAIMRLMLSLILAYQGALMVPTGVSPKGGTAS